MRLRRRIAAGVAIVAVITALPAAAGANGLGLFDWYGSSGADLDAVGLARSGTTLVSFDTDRPERPSTIGTVKGLATDTKLVGIDYRVQNRKLYGVGDRGGIYTLSDRNAKATLVGRLSVPLVGNNFGVDFNPSANALRVVGDAGQNLRQPFAATGDAPMGATVADGTLTYPATATTPAATAVRISAVAYTNNDLSADTATTLFGIDTTKEQVVIQSPANAGTVVATGVLGRDVGADAGFDIYSDVDSGVTDDVVAYATMTVGGSHHLYSINLLTGDSDQVGRFPYAVTDLAVQLD